MIRRVLSPILGHHERDHVGAIKGNVKQVISRPHLKRRSVDRRGGGENGLRWARIHPEASYFSVNWSKWLAEGGKYFGRFLPLGVCVANTHTGQNGDAFHCADNER